MSARTALITGISGQDGSYLAELLLEHSYRVCGTTRCLARPAERLAGLRDRIELFQVDPLDQTQLSELLQRTQPDEIYNLAAMTYVPASLHDPVQAAEATALSAARLLEAVRQTCPQARFFQASSSEVFGEADESPQNERTPFRPRTPYGAAKAYAHHLAGCYRASYGLFACSGILFNHESPRRGPEFVTRTISLGVARIKLGLERRLPLGNLQARRDWGFAGDYVRAMWRMLQQERPDDYIIGTGEAHTIEDFVRIAFACVGLDWREHIVVDPQRYRPAERVPLVADPTLACTRLGWEPQISFEQLVRIMVEADVEHLRGYAQVA
jgi:GDPmannose 4,6-dehydratase